MFKLKAPRGIRARLRKKLKIVDSKRYDYVVTTDKEYVEEDKINIVFREEDAKKVNRILNAIAKGEDVYITGHNPRGMKHIESRRIHYFVVEQEEVYAILRDAKFRVRHKLYEVEEMLQDKYFIRVSKYALVNINKIEYIKPAFNSKLLLIMKNGDQVEVNRRYYKTFKKTLDL